MRQCWLRSFFKRKSRGKTSKPFQKCVRIVNAAIAQFVQHEAALQRLHSRPYVRFFVLLNERCNLDTVNQVSASSYRSHRQLVFAKVFLPGRFETGYEILLSSAYITPLAPAK